MCIVLLVPHEHVNFTEETARLVGIQPAHDTREPVREATETNLPTKEKMNHQRSYFDSVLANARVNRVVLHRRPPAHKSITARNTGLYNTLGLSDSGHAKDTWPKSNIELENTPFLPGVCDVNQLSSDNLDLFAYRSSEC